MTRFGQCKALYLSPQPRLSSTLYRKNPLFTPPCELAPSGCKLKSAPGGHDMCTHFPLTLAPGCVVFGRGQERKSGLHLDKGVGCKWAQPLTSFGRPRVQASRQGKVCAPLTGLLLLDLLDRHPNETWQLARAGKGLKPHAFVAASPTGPLKNGRLALAEGIHAALGEVLRSSGASGLPGNASHADTLSVWRYGTSPEPLVDGTLGKPHLRFGPPCACRPVPACHFRLAPSPSYLGTLRGKLSSGIFFRVLGPFWVEPSSLDSLRELGMPQAPRGVNGAWPGSRDTPET